MSDPKRLQDFLKWQPDPLEVQIGHGLMYRQSKVIIYGKYKSLKSMLVKNLALDLSRGDDWIGFTTNPLGTSVFYLQLEIPEGLLHRRVTRMVGENASTRKDLVFWTEHVLKLDESSGMVKLRENLALYRPEVLIIDPLYKVLGSDMSDNHALSKVVDEFDKLIADYNMSLVLVTHARKPSKGDEDHWGSDDMLGGTILSAWADTIMKVSRDHDGLRIEADVVRNAEEEIRSSIVKMDKYLRFQVESGPFVGEEKPQV